MFLRQSTSQDIRFGPFLDSTDGVTAETGLTIAQADMQLSKDGAAYAQKNASGNATHDTDGWYSTTLNTTDTATVGELWMQVAVTGALPVWVRYWVIEEVVYDDLYGASAAGYLKPTTSGRTLDVTAGGAAGIDWGNIENATTVVDLSGTDINLCDTITTYTGNTVQTGDSFARLGAPVGASLSADIADLPTVTEFNARTLLAADYFDPATDTVANVTTVATTTTNTDMRGTDSALLATNVPTNFSSLVISVGGAADSLVQGFVNTTLTESAAGRINDNFEFFYDNSNAQTTQVVDDVGGGGGGGTDWTASERNEIRGRLGITGTTAAGGNTPTLALEASIAALNNFNPATDTVANVTLVATTTTNTDMRGTDSANTTTPPTVGAIADQVWDELLSGHSISGSTGEALSNASSAGDPWSTALPGAYAAGTAGQIVGDNLNATVSSRATQASLDIVDGIVDAILVDSNDLQTNQGNWLTATGFATETKQDAMQLNIDAILVDTDTTIPALIAGLNDFNPATDTVANVTTVATTTTNTDMRGTDSALLAANVPANFNILSISGSGFVSGNTVQINSATVLGNGTSGNLWRG